MKRTENTHRHPLFSGVSPALMTIAAMSCAALGAQEVKIYPAPDGIELSSDFKVAIGEREVPVYRTKVPPGDSIPRLSGSRKEFGYASLVSFDMRTSVDVTITCPDPVKSIKVLPTSFGIVPKVHENTITITLDAPKHVTVEVNGDWQESLHIFANPFEKSIPKPDDPDVIYFGPGVHDVTSLSVGDNKTIEGIIFLDPSRWTVPIKRSDKVHVDNIKIIGWRGNADGVDISSSRDVLVENCFMRSLDDLVVVKSRTDQGVVRNIHVRKCVLWNELAHALSIGAELREDVSNVLFEDCDVIHDVGRETALRIYHCDDAVISDVTFQDIRIEEARRLISVWIGKTRWTKTKERGHIRNVTFRNITARSAPIDPTLTGFQDGSDWKPYVIKDHASMEIIGFDQDHFVEGVLFDNVVLDGRKVEAGNVTINEFVKKVRFK